MFFQRASIARYLDWRAKLPLKTQGDQIFMGVSDKKDAENRTIMKHVYDNKKPVFSIDRINAKTLRRLKSRKGRFLFMPRKKK